MIFSVVAQTCAEKIVVRCIPSEARNDDRFEFPQPAKDGGPSLEPKLIIVRSLQPLRRNAWGMLYVHCSAG